MERWLARELARRDDSLAAFWPLTSSLRDHSGRSGHLMAHGGSGDNLGLNLATRRGGLVGVSLSSGAGTRYLHAADNTVQRNPGNQPMTWSCWVHRTTDTSSLLISKTITSPGHESGWQLSVAANGVYSFLIGGDINLLDLLSVNSEATSAVGDRAKWSHVLVTYDGSRQTSGIHIYVNGRPCKNTVVASVFSGDSSAVGSTLFVGDTGGVSEVLRLVRIYRRALSGRQVVELYRREQQADLTRFAMRSIVPIAHGSMTLFLSAYDKKNAQTTLFIRGKDNINNHNTLYLHGRAPDSASIPLYISGPTPATRALPLVVMADPVPQQSGHFSLAVWGDSQSGQRGVTTLFVGSDASGNIPTRHIPLSLLGASRDRDVRNVNLWVQGEAHQAQGGLTLFVSNKQSGILDSLSMFVSGDGTEPDWLPCSHGMNLFIKRDPTSAVTLFTKGPGTPTATGVGLFIDGLVVQSTNVPLSVPKVVGAGTGTVRLYTHGG